MSGLSDTF